LFAELAVLQKKKKKKTVDDLPSLDHELYRHLWFLKDYEGDVEDLAIDFTVTEERAYSILVSAFW
jgi:hypothetical protein